MIVVLDVVGGLVQAKFNRPMTATARRKYFAGNRSYLMWQRMVVTVELVVDHVVNTGSRNLFAGFELL